MKEQGLQRAMTLTSSCHWKALVHFCLRKKRLKNVFVTPTVDYRKILQKNRSCHAKEQQISYLMIYDVRALARKLRLLAFSGNWEIRLVFTKVHHHG